MYVPVSSNIIIYSRTRNGTTTWGDWKANTYSHPVTTSRPQDAYILFNETQYDGSRGYRYGLHQFNGDLFGLYDASQDIHAYIYNGTAHETRIYGKLIASGDVFSSSGNMSIDTLAKFNSTFATSTQYGRWIPDALNVDTSSPFAVANTCGYVWAGPGGSTNIPTNGNFSAGCRVVEFYNPTSIRVTIHGWDSSGYGRDWYNYFNGSVWSGWMFDVRLHVESRVFTFTNGWSGDFYPSTYGLLDIVSVRPAYAMTNHLMISRVNGGNACKLYVDPAFTGDLWVDLIGVV